MAGDVCCLTGRPGTFVKAHIVPEALTKPPAGKVFYQAGRGTRPIRRRTSWYDRNLVTRDGEDILRDYDTWAIAELRKHHLVWSGWGPMLALPQAAQISGDGVRVIRGIDPKRLRLFFLSLLWRAAASRMSELHEIEIDAARLERLRRLVLEGDPGPAEFFPAALVQLSTRGDAHNMTPVALEKDMPGPDGSPVTVPFFRFYFDGLVVHFHRQSEAEHSAVPGLGNGRIGASDELRVGTVPFEKSFQFENLRKSFAEMKADWPSEMARLKER